MEKVDKAAVLDADRSDLRTVLYGYGRVAPEQVVWVDNYKFTGGVCRNVPKQQAEAWRKGVRLDGKPAISRVFIQGVVANDASEVEFAHSTGIQPMEPIKLAAMIKATDARLLTEALGKTGAVALAESLMHSVAGE